MNERLRQKLVGAIAIPLSLVPFIVYGSLTSEGQLIAAKAQVAIAPPSLPEVSASQEADYRAQQATWSNKVAVLAYHGLGAGSADGDGDALKISVNQFGEQIAAMKAAGLNPVTASEYVQAIRGERELPANAVMITFDDGRTDAFLFADPILADANWRATMFVITDHGEQAGMYYQSWPNMKSLASNGRWELQAHTAGLHQGLQTASGEMMPALTSLAPGEDITGYRTRIHDDIERSVQALTDNTGTAPVAFAYPFGAYGADRTNDQQIRSVLADELSKRFVVAFEQDDQKSVPLAGCGDHPLETRRLEVGPWSGTELLDRLHLMAGPDATDPQPPCGAHSPRAKKPVKHKKESVNRHGIRSRHHRPGLRRPATRTTSGEVGSVRRRTRSICPHC